MKVEREKRTKGIQGLGIICFVGAVALMFPPASATTITIEGIYSEVNVTVPIMINAVEDVASATINLSYDPSVIVVTAAGNSDFQTFTPNLEFADQGRVKMTAFNIGGGRSGNVTFAELTIVPRGSTGANSSLDIVVEKLSDGKYQPIKFEAKNGFFHIGKKGDSQPSPTPTTSSPSSSSGSSEPEPSPTPTPSPTPSPTSLPTPSPTPSPTPLPTPPSPSPPASPTPATPASPTPSTNATMTVHIQIESVAVEKGETANTTIMINGIGDSELSAARITLNYNHKVVEVESVGGSEFDVFESNVASKGCLKMIGFQMGAAGLKGDIKFAEIKLKAVGKANKNSDLSLEIQELRDNKGNPVHFTRESGSFSVKKTTKTQTGTAGEKEIPTLGVLEIIVAVVGSYFFVSRRKQE